jgi:hypothetical protein
MKPLLTLAIAALAVDFASAQAVLHTNGGFTTGIGNGFGGADTSQLELVSSGPPIVALSAHGYEFQQSADARIADDFSVPAAKMWSLSSLRWYAYQTWAPANPTSTITDVRVRIWNLRPDLPGAAVLYGDTSTNRLVGSSFANCYRVRPTATAGAGALLDPQRAIFELQIDLSWLPPLGSGTYWIDVAGVGDSAYLAPYAVPTVPWLASDNAVEHRSVYGAWRPTNLGRNGAPCDFPFQLTGTETGLPTVYCTAKTNSLSCTPAISFTGQASATSGSGFVVESVNNLNQKPGLLLYGTTGPAAGPFGGGVLCINAPLRRSITLTSSGAPPPPLDCSGTYSIDMNAFAVGTLGGNPSPSLTVVGTTVNCQYWGRDQGFAAPNNISLSDALEYQIGP